MPALKKIGIIYAYNMRVTMHEVPHYIMLIRSSCFVNLKVERL